MKLSTDHSNREVVVDDVVGDGGDAVLQCLVHGLRFVSLLVVNTDPPPVQLGRPCLGDSLQQNSVWCLVVPGVSSSLTFIIFQIDSPS